MGKARAYVFLTALGIAGILFLLNSSPQKKETTSAQIITAWGGRGEQSVAYKDLSPVSAKEDGEQERNVWLSFPYQIPSATANSDNENLKQQIIPSPSTSFLEQNKQISSTRNNSFFEHAYSFIPTGFISTSISQTPAKTRTPAVPTGRQEEKSYFDYGNALGLEIRAFDNSHKETTAILDAFFKDYKNQSKVAALLAVARDYERLASDLSAVAIVPGELSEMHSSLVGGYRAISVGLSQLTNAGNDQEMATAALAYNASADIFTRKFVSLADFFSSRGIKFSPSDPGNIFQFNN